MSALIQAPMKFDELCVRPDRTGLHALRRGAVGHQPGSGWRAVNALYPPARARRTYPPAQSHPRRGRGVPPHRQQWLFHLSARGDVRHRARRHQDIQGHGGAALPAGRPFPDPLRFDIHRHPKRILAFGAGPHHCIGNILGRTAITIAIRRLLARFPHAKLADPDFTPVYGGAVGELRLQHLPMVI